VDADIEDVSRTAELCGLDMVQLHGRESPDYCAAVRRLLGARIVKSFRNGEIPDEEGLASYDGAEYLLLDLDKENPNRDGGAEALWEEATRVRELGHRIFLAGGLNAENVRAAIARTAPFCVDVCSGVETEPGVKDIEAVERFITEVQA
jgi:phosphoribosylanthranilate isomerase